MRYELLGPIRVVDDDRTTTINTYKIRILLAALLACSGRLVTTGQLMTEIWGDDVPRRAMAGIHVYISQLRKLLDRPGRQGSPIVTCSPGYLLELGDDELDVRLFVDLARKGKASARESCDAAAVDSLEAALALWHGPVLDKMPGGPILEGFATWLDELRTESFQILVDSQLQLGRHREIIGQLQMLVAENPLRETFYEQLMIALYRSERQAEALEVYQSARRTLVEELGLEPGRALQGLQAAILHAADDVDSRPGDRRFRWYRRLHDRDETLFNSA